MSNECGSEMTYKMRLEAAGFDLETMEKEQAIIYLLSPDLNVVYCNKAWDIFAQENGGIVLNREEVLGRPVLDAIPDALKPFYSAGFAKAQNESTPWEHEYECSSPDLFRLFHMRVLPLANNYLLVEHSLQIERVHGPERKALKAVLPLYLDRHDKLTMCSHCRRSKRVNTGAQEIWDWVPAFVKKPPALILHGLCTSCQVYYYGNA